jgi:hypothetical protein
MRRAILLAVLSFLLLAMQQEGQLHALAHFGALTARPHDRGFASPHDSGACAECALLAAASHTVTGHAVTHALSAPAIARENAVFRSRPADAPAFFSSRAPPVLL